MIRFAAFKDLTRAEQTLFGLPFVLSGALIACLQPIPFAKPYAWMWIFPAFFLARVSGMSFNQLIDRHIDAKNPRTQNRALPSGRVSVLHARIIAWGALFLFLLICLRINTLTAIFSLVAAFLLFIYSYMKRIHASCHWVLGCIHFLGSFMAYTALTGSYSLAAVFLGAAASFSIVGFDIAYAIQDFDYDRQNKLFSIPSRMGLEKSLQVSAGSHVLCVMMLLALGITLHLPLFYYGVIPLVGGIFLNFHQKIRQLLALTGTIKSLEKVFFIFTVSVSWSSLFFIAMSVLWDVLL